MDVGKRISFFREQKGMTVNKLANRAGISQSYLRSIELEEKNPTVEFLSYICEALDISLKEFFDDNVEHELKDDPVLQEFYQLTPKQRNALHLFIESMKEKSFMICYNKDLQQIIFLFHIFVGFPVNSSNLLSAFQSTMKPIIPFYLLPQFCTDFIFFIFNLPSVCTRKFCKRSNIFK